MDSSHNHENHEDDSRNVVRGRVRSLPEQRVIKGCRMACRVSRGRIAELGASYHQARYAWRYAEAYWLRAVLVFWFFSLSPAAPAVAQKPSVVYVAPIEGMINLGLASFVERVLREAGEAGAASVILETNTFGGRVDAAVLIRDALLNAKVPTVAVINKRAISAGALIALATERIVIAQGGPSVRLRRCKWASLARRHSRWKKRPFPT
jgi:hypothetical protein